MIYRCTAAAHPACVQRRHPGDVTALSARWVTTAHNDVFDIVREQLVAFGDSGQYLGEQALGVHPRQAALVGATQSARAAGGINNPYFLRRVSTRVGLLELASGDGLLSTLIVSC